MQNNKNIQPKNKKNNPHGYWEVYLGKNKLWYKCFFVNGFIYGYDIIKSFGEIRHSYYAK
jgi:hypothetical protein